MKVAYSLKYAVELVGDRIYFGHNKINEQLSITKFEMSDLLAICYSCTQHFVMYAVFSVQRCHCSKPGTLINLQRRENLELVKRGC